MNYDIYIIGCGGVGGHLVTLLPQTMACLMVDKLNPETQQEVLQSEGLNQSHIFNPFRRLVLVDGDRFSGHNALRQAAVDGSKLAVQMTRIRHSDVFTTWLNKTELLGYDLYLNPDNMPQVFNGGATPVVFMGVDSLQSPFNE